MSENEMLGYKLGLDIGIASVGWAIVSNNKVIDSGVDYLNQQMHQKMKNVEI